MTVPLFVLVLPVLILVCLGWWRLCEWLDERYFAPYLARRIERWATKKKGSQE